MLIFWIEKVRINFRRKFILQLVPTQLDAEHDDH